MTQVFLDVDRVKYKVGKEGLGGYSTGEIVDAFRILSYFDSDVEFIYHPTDEKHDTATCMDICVFNDEEGVYEPVENVATMKTFINIRERKNQ